MATANSPRPAPNPDIYDFEGLIEDAAKSALEKQGINFAVSLPQDDAKKVTDRIEAKLALGTSVLHSYCVPNTADPTSNPPGANWTYQDRWDGQIEFTIVTNRKKDRGDKNIHRATRAKVRWMIQDYVKQILPFLKLIGIFQLQEQAVSPAFSQNNEEDSSRITCLIKINILPGSFPVPS